ncbi:MAG: type II toxin-antitoxin system VapC family toxin [Geodermatophilaceae bacterium]|jgi:PIN domain nuclease of toxin-antitoxin system|nr:type II toxin-antitoxin system VapC family toxin [Geodermatophilaceae bacterium]
MSLLLDTHAFLWWLNGGPMQPAAMERISDPRVLVAVSAVSVWEIGIKRAIGKLRFDGSLASAVGQGGFDSLAISAEHAERAGDLPRHHRDPFDRMLVAQAQVENLTIVSRDEQFAAYDVSVLPC